MSETSKTLGVVGMKLMGDYSASVRYKKLQVVTDPSTGDSYASKVNDNIGNALSNTTYWFPLTRTGAAVTAANNAASNANDKAALANTKAGLANDAATNANTKAGQANDAATLANQKAGAANDAATLANQKAEAANDAATLANQKAEAANDAATLANQKAGAANDAAAAANSAAQAANTAATGAGNVNISQSKEGGIITIVTTNRDGQETMESVHDPAGEIYEVKDNVYLYKEAAGSVVTVEDAVAETVKQMRIEIAPLQDLHGYDHPWPAGGGKNLLPMTVEGIKALNTDGTWNGNAYTLNNVTFAIQTDEDGNVTGIKANGTANAYIEFFIASNTTLASLAGKTLVLNGCTGGANDTYVIQATNWNGENSSASRTGDSVSFTPTFAFNAVRIMINESVALSNNMFYPMLRLASVSDDTFEPYSNICPISGWTGARVSRTGKNLIYVPDASYADNAFVCENGIITVNKTTASSNYSIRVAYFEVPVDGEYILSGSIGGSNSTYRLNIYNEAGTTRIVDDFDGDSSVVHLSANTIYSLFIFIYANQTITNKKFYPMLRFASVADVTFEPFGTVYPVTFPQEAGTVYGGELTINQDGTGTLVVDRKKYIIDGSSGYIDNTRFTIGSIPDSVPLDLTTQYTRNDAICELLKSESWVGLTNKSTGIAPAYNGGVAVKLPGLSTAQDYQDYFTNNNLDVFVMIHPITYTLTAPQVHALLGLNSVWADTGDILSFLYATTKYHDGHHANRVYEAIEAGQEIVSFSDGAEDVPMALQVGIEPVQDLHGYDHPWPGGGGKNKLGLIFETDASNIGGVDFAHTDSYFTLNGTAPSNSYKIFMLKNPVVHSDDVYTFSVKIEGTRNSSLQLKISDGTDNEILYFSTSETQKTINIGTSMGAITKFVIEGIEGTYNCKVTVQIEKGSSFTSFAPYSNICPISGWTGAKVGTNNKNLVDLTAFGAYEGVTKSGNSYTAYSNVLVDASVLLEAGLVPSKAAFKKNTQYTLSYDQILSAYNTGIFARFEYTDGTKTDSTPGAATRRVTLTSEAGKTVSRVRIGYNNSAESTISNIMVEEGTTASEYVQEDSHTYPIDFPSEAGTVYGGTLTVNRDGTGTLVVDRLAVDMSTLGGWGMHSDPSYFYRQITGMKKNSQFGLPIILCSSYTPRSYEDVNSNDKSVGTSGDYIKVKDDSCSTSSELVEALTGVLLVYPLATPVTYDLSAPQIATLLGLNNVWADTGNILSIEYPADTKLYINKQIAINSRLLEMIITANHEDGMVATKAYTADDLMIVNGKLYKASTSIANGATLTVGTNITATTVAAEIAALA